jgi:hypothetical protein
MPPSVVQETTVRRGNGDGTFQSALNSPAPAGLGPLAMADFNGDGIPDAAVLTGPGLTVLFGNGDARSSLGPRMPAVAPLGWRPEISTVTGCPMG